jgi:uncharacterized Rmd1/YagE family protein
MRCTSYCTADSYNIRSVHDLFVHNTRYSICKLYDHSAVLHLCFIGGDSTSKKQDVFIFEYGCVVFWGGEKKFEAEILKHLSVYAKNLLSEQIVDNCSYEISRKGSTAINDETDVIHLCSHDSLIKLSFSYGLSQSVKLITFEDSVDRTIEENKVLPQELMQKGTISLSRRSLAKKIGMLFAERHLISLNASILDTPEFFWKRPKYEPYYEMAIKNLELRQRIDVLNDRLDIIHELYTILSNDLQHSSSARLEVTIVLLILIEVLLLILKDILHVI